MWVVGNGYMGSGVVPTTNKVWSLPSGHAKGCGVSPTDTCKETTEVSQWSRKSLSFLLDRNGRLDLQKAAPAVYSHGEYYGLGKLAGTFGYSVRKTAKIPGKRKK